jgi:hypothetical protein
MTFQERDAVFAARDTGVKSELAKERAATLAKIARLKAMRLAETASAS